MDYQYDDNYHLRSKALDKAETAGSLKAVEEMLQGARLVVGFLSGAETPALAIQPGATFDGNISAKAGVITITGTADTNVLDFPLVDDAMVAKPDLDPGAPVNRKERKPRGPNKLKASKGKRGKPTKVKASDTGDAPGDAPATAPVPNGAAPHIDPPHEVEQPPMAA